MTESMIILEDFIRSNPDARELKRALAVKFVKLGIGLLPNNFT